MPGIPIRTLARLGVSGGSRAEFVIAWVLLVIASCQSRCLAAAADEPSAAPQAMDLTQVGLEQLMNLKVETVYGASRYEQNVTEAPSAVTIITADEIAKFGHRTLADVLQSVGGLYVTYDRNYSYLGVRGFNRPGDYSSRILVLVDGHRINETVFDAALIGNDFILDVDNIKRVEVIRGPSSSIYGNNAFFGVINVVTKTGSDIMGTELSGWTGSYGTYNGRFTYGNKFTNGVEMLVSGSYYTSDGQENLYYPQYNTPLNNINNGLAHRADYEETYKLFTVLHYSDFGLEGGLSTRKKGVPTGAFGTIFNDPAFKTTDDRAYVNVDFHHAFEDDWTVSVNAAFDHYHYYGDYPVLYPDDTTVKYQDYALGNSWSTDVQVNKKLFDRHTLTFGGEFRDNFQQDQGNQDNYTPQTIYNDRRSSMTFGLYSQAEIQLLKPLALNAGVRYDWFDTFGDTVNPRIGLIYHPFSPTTVKLLYGTAFNAPNVYELDYAGPNNKGNPNLRPETITTYEAVLDQRVSERVDLVASGYYYEIDHLINQELDPNDSLLVYRNVDEVTAFGIETGAQAKFENGIQVRLSYTYQETEDHATHSQVSNSPNHMGKLNLILPFFEDKLFGGIEFQYRSEAKTLASRETDPFWLMNVTLFSQRFFKGLEASASIYNLFDTRYYYPAAGEHLQDQLEQDGRSFRVKLTYRF